MFSELETNVSKWKKWALGCGSVVMLAGLFAISRTICISAWFQGMSTRYCPASKVIPELYVNLSEIRRGEKSSINFNLSGRFLTKPYEFENSGIELKWMEYGPFDTYEQCGPNFSHEVSIIDTIAVLGKETIAHIRQ